VGCDRFEQIVDSISNLPCIPSGLQRRFKRRFHQLTSPHTADYINLPMIGICMYVRRNPAKSAETRAPRLARWGRDKGVGSCKALNEPCGPRQHQYITALLTTRSAVRVDSYNSGFGGILCMRNQVNQSYLYK
jgi:hypothetical protein